MRSLLLLLLLAFLGLGSAGAFSPQRNEVGGSSTVERREVLSSLAGAAGALSALVPIIAPAAAADKTFTPGGSLVEREVGIRVGNPEASPSRSFDNGNVLFGQDHYFKFGAAAPWIEPGGTDFPKTMPFTPSQQRYDILKKYGIRVVEGTRTIESLGETIRTCPPEEYGSKILASDAPEYMLRPMGLMANGFLASENTGATNELLLARWYINEIYLDIGDIRAATSEADALKSLDAAKKSINSYYGLLNRVITIKVGDPFELVKI